ncbi:hypothetical protein FHW79_003648 [Azospirillum sp. OGB3]|uniref:hypothetical protein n=1 Tax=Azospirillum sp. OGB3 TaxID=2587012 RepID=UPI00160679DF|nr:hypothetical protein [Azospirillum sp. OGB3]MBB3266015.1 hypothetical protein [Azospirillum sp. OGB3]
MENPDVKPIVAALLEPLPPLVKGRNDLSDPGVVELLVRGYVDQCLAAFQEVLRGNIEQDAAIDAINAQATALNAVFLGTSGFNTVVVHPWNSADQLGQFLQDTIGLDFPAEDCVRAALIHLATHVMHAIQGGTETWEQQVDSLVGEMRDLLIGRLPDGA